MLTRFLTVRPCELKDVRQTRAPVIFHRMLNDPHKCPFLVMSPNERQARMLMRKEERQVFPNTRETAKF